MSIQEKRTWLHQLIDIVDDKITLEDAGRVLSGQVATLAHLTVEQRTQLDQAMQEHKEGKTVSHAEMKQQYHQVN